MYQVLLKTREIHYPTQSNKYPKSVCSSRLGCRHWEMASETPTLSITVAGLVLKGEESGRHMAGAVQGVTSFLDSFQKKKKIHASFG